jgi:hypothetical protein
MTLKQFEKLVQEMLGKDIHTTSVEELELFALNNLEAKKYNIEKGVSNLSISFIN